MNQTDVYFRAFTNYRKLTVANRECTSLRTAFAENGIDGDKVEVTRVFCTIEEDWVNAIEEGLIHVEKAIKEERQFIRSNGEVIPIEKVKHVSKESVEHLAKHSDLITRYHEGEDLIPDKLYTVERLSDYAVYENRFLYMLLCYLRDFITLRYNDILDLTNRYDATVTMDKSFTAGKQKVSYTLTMHDVRRDDPYLKENNPARSTIDRIGLILKAVLAFLSTPLMEDVAKTPMLKPPITKTNVLKMDNNFKGAVALYDFVVTYDKPGYTTETKITTLAPFKEAVADEMAEIGSLASFLTYQHGLGITPLLKEAYAREEERLKAEEVKRTAKRIEALKRRLKKTGVGMEEYILTIEKQLRALEGEAARAQALAEEVERRKQVEEELRATVEGLTRRIETLEATLAEERHQHFLEIEALKKKHIDEMHDLIEKHEEEVARMEREHAEQLEELKESTDRELARMAEEVEEAHRTADAKVAEIREETEATINAIREETAEEISAIRAEADAKIAAVHERTTDEISFIRDDAAKRIAKTTADCAEKVADAEKRARDYNEALASSSEALIGSRRSYELLMGANYVAEARIKALGGIETDHIDRESFGQLEREFHAFRALYREQWQKAKKNIRRTHLSKENIRRKTEPQESSD